LGLMCREIVVIKAIVPNICITSEKRGETIKMKRVALILIAALLISVVLSGCVLTDKLTALKQGFNKGQLPENKENLPTVVIETPETTPAADTETKTITLYFSDENGEKLVAEDRSVPKVIGIARASIEELIKGPTQAGLKATLPVAAKLLDINIRPDGLCIVDFSKELIDGLPVAAKNEKLAVYSIVNTLTQFPTVERVEMRIEGKNVDTLLGYVKLNENLVRNAALIK